MSKDLNIQEILFGDVRELHNARFMMTKVFLEFRRADPTKVLHEVLIEGSFS
jgi:hypothetical protein